MSRSRPWSSANPDLRRQTQVAAPAIEPLEQELYNLARAITFSHLLALAIGATKTCKIKANLTSIG